MGHGCSSDPAVWAVDRPAPAASGVRGLDRSRPACALVRRGDGDGPERGAAGERTGTDQQLTGAGACT